MASIVQFVTKGVFDDATISVMGDAFDAARKELHDQGQPDLVQEVIAKRIIAAAHRGERNVIKLRDIALVGLPGVRSAG